MVVLLAFLACGGSDLDKTKPYSPSPDLASPAAMLTRASLDVRGVRPSVADIDQVNADPNTLDALVTNYLWDDRFPFRVMDLYSEIFLTDGEQFPVPFSAFSFDEDISPTDYVRAIGEEPLRLLATVAAEDLPYTDLVTADWTVHNHVLGAMYPSDYPSDGVGWKTSQYTDGRPAAGILSTNGMWWRYGSTNSNLNRKRANQISRIFLCNDYLARPIEFTRDLNLLDEAAVADAIENNPGCVACHLSLDPIASHLYGFWYVDEQSAADATVYHPEREQYYREMGAPNPGYYGQTASGLEGLGHKIAADPRFIECAVQTAFSRLMGRDATLSDTKALTVHREVFLNEGLTLRALFWSILTHPRYRAGADAPDGFAQAKFVSADLLASQIKGITGFEWTQDGTRMMKSDTVGVGNLAGRADGYRMARNIRSPNATMLLVSARLAEVAATHVIKRESEQTAAQREVFIHVDFSEHPDTNAKAMVRQLQHLHKAVLGREVSADGQEVNANLALWTELFNASDDPYVAWGGVLIALLRDPDFLMY
jgi:hypothetical protein